jgi:gliding motility-associated protein GldM
MAHERLSPRQKMIGMMYLVLTAMLALNVSKEAIEAFKNVDKGLTQTIALYSNKNDNIYKDFDRAASENPIKAGKLRSQAYEVKQRADEAYNFIQDLKIEIINKAEGTGPSNLVVKGRNIYVDEIDKKIDDTNIPSEILIGANENGKANDLKAVLQDYREFLLGILEGKNPTIEEALKKSLNTDDGINKDGQKERWENLNFQTLPLIAVITILSEMQVNVRNGETEILNFLYSQIDASSFKFNKLSPMVIPTISNYVTLGSDYEAEVFISATDSTQKPKITVNGNQVLPIDDSGKGHYKIKATSVGTKKWGGVIAMKAPDGTTINYPFDATYIVGEPNVVVSPTAMNVLYYGIDNPIDVSVPNVSPDKIKIKVINGEYKIGKVKNSKGENFRGNWIVRPTDQSHNVQVIVTADIGGKPMQFAPLDFRVKPVPPPIAVFGGKSTGTISRATAAAQQGVFAILPDFDFDLTYQVTGFTFFYTDKGMDQEEVSKNSYLTAKQKEMLGRLTRGKNLIIKDITALGPDGKTRELNPIILKIN